VFVGSFAHRRAYLPDLEQTWGLTRVFLPSEGEDMLVAVKAIVEDPETPELWRARRAAMLAHAGDVSTWYYDLLTELHDAGLAATLARRSQPPAAR
jgi:hypothetical protein